MSTNELGLRGSVLRSEDDAYYQMKLQQSKLLTSKGAKK